MHTFVVIPLADERGVCR